MKIIFICLSLLILSSNSLTQQLSLEEIKANLINNPPNTGDQMVREISILALDNILKHDSSRTSLPVLDFYRSMMEKVQNEYYHPYSSSVIWIMYNHGFIVKTPKVTFAFDLVPGYKGWPSDILPAELVENIKILFISHRHGDHKNDDVIRNVEARGGYVFTPYTMAPGDSLVLFGLRIKAYMGLHNVASNIYEVLTPSGLKILHTGDNQTSETLPMVKNLNVLLLNGWVNESGRTSAVTGMRNSIFKITPSIMIPGHLQELGHDYLPDLPRSRAPYEWAFEVNDIPLPTEVSVMAWGEQYICSDVYNKAYVCNVNINKPYIHADRDTLIITSEVINVEHQNISVESIIESFDESYMESIPLYDDGLDYDQQAGDGLFSGTWVAPSIERSYHIHTKTVHIDSGYHDIFHNLAQVTTIGPIIIESDTINSSDHAPNPGDNLKYRFYLQNLGSHTTATNITSKIFPLDTCSSIQFTVESSYGDIAPGEIVLGDKSQYIRFSNNCSVDYQTKFALQIYSEGYHFWTDTFKIDVVSSIVNGESELVNEFKLYQNHPNPFNPNTIINYELPITNYVELSVYNILGQKIATLISERLPAGYHEIEFNGEALSSGVYLYRIVVDSFGEAGNWTDVKKMLLVK